MVTKENSWNTTNVAWESINVPASDLAQVQELLRRAIRDLSQEFESEGGINLLSDLMLRVQLHTGGGAEAGMKTEVVSGRPTAKLELLAPSAISAGARTIVGEPKDGTYVHKTVVHELSMLFLWQITRRKSVGWGFFSAPEWLVDGWEEFLSLTKSTEHSRLVSLPSYRRRVAARWAAGAPGEIDRYLDGAIILDFMHERFGRDAMLRLLRSTQQSFSLALGATLGVDDAQLLVEFSRWIQSNAV